MSKHLNEFALGKESLQNKFNISAQSISAHFLSSQLLMENLEALQLGRQPISH